jgi:acyl CoA:acetate/3-ketoacid CoA transferase beta subunit
VYLVTLKLYDDADGALRDLRIFVKRVIRSTRNEKRIERRMIRHDRAVFSWAARTLQFSLFELAPGVTLEQVRSCTEAHFAF